MSLAEPLNWTEEELRTDLLKAVEAFRKERAEEPLEAYLQAFDKYRVVVEDLLRLTGDLDNLSETAPEILADPHLLIAFRYIAGPPISADDLRVLANASLSPRRFAHQPEILKRLIEVVRLGLDRKRFPWVGANRGPTESERETAVIASAALIASSATMTTRRNLGKNRQEEKVEFALGGMNFRKVPTRSIPTLGSAPGRGEFCRESKLGNRKADFIVRLWDDRVMPIECKVSNSATNSVKRLNNDAAVKANVWRRDFGETQVVPAAVLSGVFKLHNLIDAQKRHLMLIWAHDLAKLAEWIARTRP